MSHVHSLDAARKFAGLAMNHIAEHDLLPMPDNYELWFVYCSDSHPELEKAVDVVLERNDGKINDEQCYEIFQQYLSGHREEETVQKAGDKIQKTIEDVNAAVHSAKNFAVNYSQNLENINEELQDDKTQDEIEVLLSGVLHETKDMIGHNEHLEEMLGHSNRAMEDMRRDLEVARREALTDSLTGLANRKAFEQEIRHLLSIANGDEPYAFTMLLLDIDHFKVFNDSFGHQIGDQVLTLVARTLKEGVKGRDIAIRYGGEEFVILLPETDIKGGMKVAEILRKEVEKKEVINRLTGKVIAKITMSAGVSEYIRDEDLDDFIERVDGALYDAKNAGRNRVVAAAS